MGMLFRLLTMLGSARNAREAISSARHSVDQVKTTANQFRAASFQRSLDKANEGEVNAQYDMGEYYYEGRGVDRDWAEAFGWFLKAAEQGHGSLALTGLVCLGDCFYPRALPWVEI